MHGDIQTIQPGGSGRRPAGRRGAAGFTLVELLVVITIISLLVGILVPAVQTAIKQAEDARVRTRVVELAVGCDAYYMEYNYCPGQAYPEQLTGDGGAFTGSQWLAKALFTDDAATVKFPHPKWAPMKSEDLQTLGDPPKQDSIGDRTSKPMAILYYPARLGTSGVSQYKIGDNSAYTGSTSQSTLEGYVKNTSVGGQPRNEGQFVIFAPGIDREYFTGDDPRFPAW